MASVLIPSADGKALPYRWGAWCGFIALISALVDVMYALKAANETAPLGLLSEFLLVAVSLALVPVSLAAGLGLLMRRRYGVILFFILCGLRFLLKLRETWSSGAAQSEMAIALCGGFLLFLIPNLIYFKKRWWGLEKKQ